MNPQTQTMTVLSPVEILELVGDFEIPCDFFVDGKVLCQGEAAKWVMHRNPCCPTSATTPAVACDICKDARLHDMIALECHFCGHTYEHSTDAYTLIEKLDKRGDR